MWDMVSKERRRMLRKIKKKREKKLKGGGKIDFLKCLFILDSGKFCKVPVDPSNPANSFYCTYCGYEEFY